ncbi:orexin/Hypocretin receptor type 1-like [Phymastichus coffea]|uniref:orexin/Hypocretin receptor type 1-like n=1 Tax=Phymastichus coffea TaxID=108790 RepID=UPI00273BB1E4|nr:orexin/Hypocretin receptor type 1-like [Phymastichus coffea]
MESLMIITLIAAALAIPSKCDEYKADEPDGNCTNPNNKPCVSDEDYLDMMYDYIVPESYEWLLIGMHIFVFVIGLVGNALVCLAVYRNHSMRTVTNYFIVNLALADLLVIIVCLPPTILWDITETWFLGVIPCKIVLYLQTVSVTVSVLTLTFISIDRWYAICYPLRFKSTTGRAKTAIFIIWAVALTFDIPDLIVMTTRRDTAAYYASVTVLFTQCSPSWSIHSQRTFTILKFILLYTAPLTFMSFAYCQIIRVLWRNDIPGHHNLSTRIINANDLSSQTSVGNPEGQLKSRRKAAKMLVAVVLMFAICCFPVHFFLILRENMNIKVTKFNTAMSCLIHWLLYANSAINPLIYNFMSGKFRTEFKRTFCWPSNGSLNNSRGGDMAYRMAGMSQSYAYYLKYRRSVHQQTKLNNNNNVGHSTKCVPLGGAVCASSHQPTYHYSEHR